MTHYLDHNATSPLRPEAWAAMKQAIVNAGNASSVHGAGRGARRIVEEARDRIGKLVRTHPDNVIFTSGGTEANWLALTGAVDGALAAGERIERIFVSAIEHDSVRLNASRLGQKIPELQVETIPAHPNGTIDLDFLSRELCDKGGRSVVAIMSANNETGVLQPIEAAREICWRSGGLLMVDAVQTAGRAAIPVGADYLTLSAHKMGGPQGVGALIVGETVPFATQILGGRQERGLRAGTENVPAIAGFGAVAAIEPDCDAGLRDRFEIELRRLAGDVVIFGEEAPRLPNTSNFAIHGIESENSLMALDLDGVMISSGAACSSGAVKVSHVLKAMNIAEDLARCAVRVSFGWNSTVSDVDAAIASLGRLLARTRAREAA